MLIVGMGAALTAIAVYLAVIFVKSLRASWRARRAETIPGRDRGSERGHEARAGLPSGPAE